MNNLSCDNGERTLLWVSATPGSFTPDSLKGWHRVDLVGFPGVILSGITPSADYTVIFEATCNSTLDYDPVIHARAIWSHFQRVPDRLVALVAPSLEVPVATQHAIACEVGKALGGARIDVVTVAEHWSARSEEKMRKGPSEDDDQQSFTALDEALEIVAGQKRGAPVDPEAVNFVYAYTTNVRQRTPFRFTRLQREILRVMASGIRPTTAVLAKELYTSKNRVNDSITELVDALVPRAVGEKEVRDSHGRLYWLVYRYGVWIRLVNGRR
jgi:hypothetical protein